jgi:hypothetical protein
VRFYVVTLTDEGSKSYPFQAFKEMTQAWDCSAAATGASLGFDMDLAHAMYSQSRSPHPATKSLSPSSTNGAIMVSHYSPLPG